MEDRHERGLLAPHREDDRLVGTLTVDRPTEITKYRH